MKEFNPAHICWKPDDPDLPEDLQEVVGEWGLGVCKLCGRTERQLEDRCIHELCPFCGGNPVSEYYVDRGYRIQCENRHKVELCPVNMRTHHYPTEAEAWAAWDIRKPIQEVRDYIKRMKEEYLSVSAFPALYALENVEEMIR